MFTYIVLANYNRDAVLKKYYGLGELEKINWPQIFDHDTTADPLITYDQQFSTKLDEVINTHFPLKVVKFNKHKHKKCKWMTHTLLTKI